MKTGPDDEVRTARLPLGYLAGSNQILLAPRVFCSFYEMEFDHRHKQGGLRPIALTLENSVHFGAEFSEGRNEALCIGLEAAGEKELRISILLIAQHPVFRSD